MENIFHLETSSRSGTPLEIDFTKHDVLKIIEIFYKKRFKKLIGTKFAIIYLEKYGKEGLQDLNAIGLDGENIKEEYEKHKTLFGQGIH